MNHRIPRGRIEVCVLIAILSLLKWIEEDNRTWNQRARREITNGSPNCVNNLLTGTH
jgi:hypothetical protein